MKKWVKTSVPFSSAQLVSEHLESFDGYSSEEMVRWIKEDLKAVMAVETMLVLHNRIYVIDFLDVMLIFECHER